MARRPEPGYKIIQDNRSSYNLIGHIQQRVPDTPLFKPGDEERYGPNAARFRAAERPEQFHWQQPPGVLNSNFDRDSINEPGYKDELRPQKQEADYKTTNNGMTVYNRIKHDTNHLPSSPLYEHNSPRRAVGFDPNQGRDTSRGYGNGDAVRSGDGGGPQLLRNDPCDPRDPLDQYDPRDPHDQYDPRDPRDERDPRYDPHYDPRSGGPGDRSDRGADMWTRKEDNYQLPPPVEETPTPKYSTTQLQLVEDEPQSTRLDLNRLRRREHDIRDYRGNPMPHRDIIGGIKTDRGEYVAQDTSRSMSIMATVPSMANRGASMVAGGVRNGGALLFIRFPVGDGNDSVASHAFLKAKVHDNGGRYLGLARKVHDFGYPQCPSEAIGVYHFPNMDKATLFFQLDFTIRQPDFPAPYGHASMWIVCNAYLPDNMDLFNTFFLSEAALHAGIDRRSYFEKYQMEFEEYLYKNGAMPFVICSYGSQDRKSIRRHSYQPHVIVTCHLFQGTDHLDYIMNSEQGNKFRNSHTQMAVDKYSIFTLKKDHL